MAFSNRILMSSLSPIAPNKTQQLPISAKKTQELPISANKPQNLLTTNVMTFPFLSVAYKQNITHEPSLVSTPSQGYMDEYREKIKEIKWVFRNTENPLESLVMIDSLQHLAIDYHFKEEIETILSREYTRIMTSGGVIGAGDDDLYNISLRFRLLRQNGYKVPSDVFNNFKDKDGEFELSLSTDLRGMMGLYEASHLGIGGEDILDEANAFASEHLNASVTHLAAHQARVVKDALEHPFHKSLTSFNAKHYTKNSKSTYGINGVLKELAQMDFDIAQSLHQGVLLEISMWWKDLGLAQELKFARDQQVKWYTWSMAILSDPSFSEERIRLTRPISFIYLMDDIFNVYGTFDELVLFTEVLDISNNMNREHMSIDVVEVLDRSVEHLNDRPSNKKQVIRTTDQGKPFPPKEISSKAVETHMLVVGGMPKDSTSSEKGVGKQKDCSVSNLAKDNRSCSRISDWINSSKCGV